MKRSKVGAKDFFAERIVVQVELAHIGRDGFIAGPHLLKPDPVVMAEGLTHGKAGQAGTVALPSIPLIAQAIELQFGNGRKPPAETVAILVSAQLFNVGDAVVVGVDEWIGWT